MGIIPEETKQRTNTSANSDTNSEEEEITKKNIPKYYKDSVYCKLRMQDKPASADSDNEILI